MKDRRDKHERRAVARRAESVALHHNHRCEKRQSVIISIRWPLRRALAGRMAIARCIR
jgi:hypothetical protein